MSFKYLYMFAFLTVLTVPANSRAETELVLVKPFDWLMELIHPQEPKPFGFIPEYIEGCKRSRFTKCEKNTLKIIFPKGRIGPEQAGYNFHAKLGSQHSYAVSYGFKFDSNFDFVKGGKLPGLGGGTGTSGGEKVTGTNGFTSRIVWKQNGQGLVYVYHVNQQGKYGDIFSMFDPDTHNEIRFPRGAWQNVRMEVTINDVVIDGGDSKGEPNGVIKVLYNGKTVFEKRDFVFRTVDTFSVDLMYFETFFGGGDDSWAPAKKQTLYVRDLKGHEL